MGLRFTFQQDSNLKHTAKKYRKGFFLNSGKIWEPEQEESELDPKKKQNKNIVVVDDDDDDNYAVMNGRIKLSKYY